MNSCQAAGRETAQLTKRAILHFISQSVYLCECVPERRPAAVCVPVRANVGFILTRSRSSWILLRDQSHEEEKKSSQYAD